MANIDRPRASADGQLDDELRNRVLSGFQSSRLAALAALLDSIGPPAWVSGPTGAALLRLDGYHLTLPFHVAIPRGRHVNRIGHVIHTVTEFPPIDCETAQDLPVFSPTRILIDLARSATDEELTAALEGALRDGLTTEDHLHRRISALRSPGRYGIPRLVRLMEQHELRGGTQSWLEREYLRLVTVAGLPQPVPQQVVSKRRTSLIRVDFHFPGTPVVVEVLGYRWHRTTVQMSIDAERLTRLTLDGTLVAQFTYAQITKDPDYVVATTAEALLPYRA